MKESLYLLCLALDNKLSQEKIIEIQAEKYLEAYKKLKTENKQKQGVTKVLPT